VSHGLPQLESQWQAMVTRLVDAHTGETELASIVEDFDGLLGDSSKTQTMSVIGHRIAYMLKQVILNRCA